MNISEKASAFFIENLIFKNEKNEKLNKNHSINDDDLINKSKINNTSSINYFSSLASISFESNLPPLCKL